MAQFSVPSSPKRNSITINEFLGADFTNLPSAVDERMSPNLKNMIRDVPGKVRKCMGYRTIKTYDGKINGYHKIHGLDEGVVHAGTKMYLGDSVLYENANDARSNSWQFEDRVVIADGKELLIFDGSSVKKAAEVSKIPVVTIAKSPSGGGTPYEGLNLINAGFTELFLGTESDTAYHLSFDDLDNTSVKAYVLDVTGDWIEKVEGTDFSVDRQNGIINFVDAPGKSPVTGEDNVKVTAYRTVSGYGDRINKCTFGIQYGVSGAADRLFLSGNPDYINLDWYSGQYDPTYFPDTGYSQLGSPRSAVMGYSIINNYLATHKDELETDKSIILREGILSDDEPMFRIVNTLKGVGAISKDTFCYLANEPLFLTRLGIYAVTAQDVTGEKYGQDRSFYLNGKLTKETGLEDAFAYTYKDMYWLCINDVAYILDGLQPIRTDKADPYSTRQYVGFYRTNLPANVMWEKEGILFFGSKDGRVCEFYTDHNSPQSYSDDGAAIEAIWDTPDIDGKAFYKNKTFRYLAVRLQSAIATSVSIYGQKRGEWSLIKRDESVGNSLSFQGIVFSKLVFACDATQKIITQKIRMKKVDKVRFRLVNDSLHQPFGLYDIAIEYIENGNCK